MSEQTTRHCDDIECEITDIAEDESYYHVQFVRLDGPFRGAVREYDFHENCLMRVLRRRANEPRTIDVLHINLVRQRSDQP